MFQRELFWMQHFAVSFNMKFFSIFLFIKQQLQGKDHYMCLFVENFHENWFESLLAHPSWGIPELQLSVRVFTVSSSEFLLSMARKGSKDKAHTGEEELLYNSIMQTLKTTTQK